jgi:hypothetical protein
VSRLERLRSWLKWFENVAWKMVSFGRVRMRQKRPIARSRRPSGRYMFSDHFCPTDSQTRSKRIQSVNGLDRGAGSITLAFDRQALGNAGKASTARGGLVCCAQIFRRNP